MPVWLWIRKFPLLYSVQSFPWCKTRLQGMDLPGGIASDLHQLLPTTDFPRSQGPLVDSIKVDTSTCSEQPKPTSEDARNAHSPLAGLVERRRR